MERVPEGKALVCPREDIVYGIWGGTPRFVAADDSGVELQIGSQFLEWWSRAGPLHSRQRTRAHGAVASLAGPGQGSFACDVGAGTTALSQLLAGRGWTVFALDLYPPKEIANVETGNVRRVVASMMRPPFADESLDLVVFSASLQYVPDAAACLAAWRRKLRPSGTILCALTPVHHTSAGARRAETHARTLMRKTAAVNELATMYHHFTRDELVTGFQKAGLGVEFLAVPFTRGFQLVRFAKNLVVGPDLAKFPMIRARPVTR